MTTDGLLAALRFAADAGDAKAAWMLRLLRQSLHVPMWRSVATSQYVSTICHKLLGVGRAPVGH